MYDTAWISMWIAEESQAGTGQTSSEHPGFLII